MSDVQSISKGSRSGCLDKCFWGGLECRGLTNDTLSKTKTFSGLPSTAKPNSQLFLEMRFAGRGISDLDQCYIPSRKWARAAPPSWVRSGAIQSSAKLSHCFNQFRIVVDNTEIGSESFGLVVYRFVGTLPGIWDSVGPVLGPNPIRNRKCPAGSFEMFGARAAQPRRASSYPSYVYDWRLEAGGQRKNHSGFSRLDYPRRSMTTHVTAI